jgi:TusA-related sulfurtransferase
MDSLSEGDVLEVIATDSGSMADFRGWVKTAKHALLREQRTETDEGRKTIYVHVLDRMAQLSPRRRAASRCACDEAHRVERHVDGEWPGRSSGNARGREPRLDRRMDDHSSSGRTARPRRADG